MNHERIAALIIHMWFSETTGHLYCTCPGGFVPFLEFCKDADHILTGVFQCFLLMV